MKLTLNKEIIAIVFVLGLIVGCFVPSLSHAAEIEAMVSQDWRIALPAELPEPTQVVAALNQ